MSNYDIHDSDIAIFNKYEINDQIENDEENNINNKNGLYEQREKKLIESERKMGNEENINYEIKKFSQKKQDILYYRKTNNKDTFSYFDESKNINNNSMKSQNY